MCGYVERYSIEWRWKDRKGKRHAIDVPIEHLTEQDINKSRETAKAQGYPGHSGGWWNWLVDDMHDFLTGKRKSAG